MAEIQSMNALVQTAVEPAISIAGGTPAGNGGKGLFGSIISKVVETANQSGGETEAKNAVGTEADGTAKLGALVRQLAVQLGRETPESSAVAATSRDKIPESEKSARGKVSANSDETVEEDNLADQTQVDQSQVKDPAQVAALLGQMLNGLKVSLQSRMSEGEDDSKRTLIEKSIQRIEEKLDEMQIPWAMAVAGAQSTETSVAPQNIVAVESRKIFVDRNMDFEPALSGNVNVAEKDSLMRIVDSLKKIVEGQDVAKSPEQVDNGPERGFAAGLMVKQEENSVISPEKVANVLPYVKPEITGKADQKHVSASSKGIYEAPRWKNFSGTAPSSEVKVDVPKVGATMAESPVKTDASVDAVVGPDLLKITPAPSPSSAGGAVSAKVEAKAAETSLKTDDSVEQKAVSVNAVSEDNANAKPATVRGKAFEWGGRPAFRETAGEQGPASHAGKQDQSGNGGNSAAGIEASVKSASSAAGASGDPGNMSGKGEDNAKGSLKFAEVNVGMRSNDISAQSPAKPDAISGEPANNISHEQIMDHVREKIAETPLKGNSGVISLKLNPEELGELKVHVRLEDQTLKVEVIAENRVVKDALVQNMNSLKETLSRHNLTVEKFDVFTAGNGGSNQQQFREGRQSAWNQPLNGYDRYAVPDNEERAVSAKYLDQGENSLVDVRF